VPWKLKTEAPGTVVVAGVIVGLQGLAALAFTVALLVAGLTANPKPAGNVYAEAVFFLIMTAAVLAVGGSLLAGRRWARTPAAVLQVLLIGVAYYVIGPSGQLAAGIATGVLCLACLVLLFTARARAWAVDDTPPSYGG
jgi:hypothetical protein